MSSRNLYFAIRDPRGGKPAVTQTGAPAVPPLPALTAGSLWVQMGWAPRVVKRRAEACNVFLSVLLRG